MALVKSAGFPVWRRSEVLPAALSEDSAHHQHGCYADRSHPGDGGIHGEPGAGSREGGRQARRYLELRRGAARNGHRPAIISRGGSDGDARGGGRCSSRIWMVRRLRCRNCCESGSAKRSGEAAAGYRGCVRVDSGRQRGWEPACYEPGYEPAPQETSLGCGGDAPAGACRRVLRPFSRAAPPKPKSPASSWPRRTRPASTVPCSRLSPDGRTLAFAAIGAEGRSQIWLKPMNSLKAHVLAGTDGVGAPIFWSPDGRSASSLVRSCVRLRRST